MGEIMVLNEPIEGREESGEKEYGNTGNCLPDDMASHPRRQLSS
jgi:hypothetical protein